MTENKIIEVTLWPGRTQTHCRQHPRRSHTDDSREPHRREGRDGKSCGESNQQRESVEVTIIGLYMHF